MIDIDKTNQFVHHNGRMYVLRTAGRNKYYEFVCKIAPDSNFSDFANGNIANKTG